MNKFSYLHAGDANRVVAALAFNNNARCIAGGTNLLDLMKVNVMCPDELIDINHLSFNTITEHNGGLRLGATVTNAATAYHPLVQQRYPLLSRAILAGASPQLRNMATDGGNLMQRTRCYYFYDTATPCNKREPGSGCSAINGYNRIHAVLGQSEQCIATHPSDMCVALAALEAVVNVQGKKGGRSIAFTDFHRLPGETPWIDNNLQQDEIITSIDLPGPGKGFNQYFDYVKLRDRASYAFALVSVAIAFELNDDAISEARIALGGVAHKPWRKPEAEDFLQGKTVTAANLAGAAAIILEGAKGYPYNNFKMELAKSAIIRAGLQAVKTEGIV